MQEEVDNIDARIQELNDKIEFNENLINDQVEQLINVEANESVIRDIVLKAWTSKIQPTIWAREKCENLLERFEKVSGFKLELENPNERSNFIENNNKSNNNILKVKLNSINFDLPSVVVFPASREKRESQNVLEQIGYNDDGKIEQISPNIIQVPEQLPWFITNLDNAFQFTQAEEIKNLDKWDTSNVTSMQEMFSETSTFNQSLDRWNVSKVRNFRKMLWSASNFKKSIASWNIDESATTDNFMNVNVPIYQTRNSFSYVSHLATKTARF
ncbi:Hypothetical protein, DUF285 family [Mycoplasma yeatsii 13926]|uniref:PARCEL domain-containing protein n=1 Tax=Mycoplasma yeatsii 13926 TaxID=1188240 RepID=S6G6R0_9MOLU|nr:BspA family leucine-rich repeat surface protein [Mycoplasma yeatsii]EOA06958.1 Hypothetical protein, DUF285 family [Mycoplasma yeatsii 13926]